MSPSLTRIGSSGGKTGFGFSKTRRFIPSVVSALNVSRSLRFRSSSSKDTFLSRTFDSGGNTKTWTWSGWVKRSSAGTGYLFSSGNFYLGFVSDRLVYNDLRSTSFGTILQSNSVFRDYSSWYHIILSVNYSATNPTDRAKIYVNGLEISYSTTSYPGTGEDSQVNNAVSHFLGSSPTSTNYFVGYLANVQFIDGLSLTPDNFGFFDSNLQWQPKAYEGSYGTTGFYLDFADNSNNTSTTLGKDNSGFSRNWTPNSFSVTTGTGNDSLIDSPSSYGTDTGLGGEVSGNYCTLNELENPGLTITGGNLDATRSLASWSGCRATQGIGSGKWYWEFTNSGAASGSSAAQVGITLSSGTLTNYAGASSGAYVFDTQNGTKWSNNTQSGYFGSASGAGVVHGIAFDADNGTITFYRGGSSPGTAYASIPIGTYFPVVSLYNSAGFINFGQRPFTYTAPSGFKALCDTNLPTPTIVKPSTVMDVKLYTGNGGTQTISGLGFSPDFVWIKGRSVGAGHLLADTVRGIDKSLYSNGTDAEDTYKINGYVSAASSSDFTVTTGSTNAITVNQSSATYVAWCWDAGSSTNANTAGTISSQVRANASAGFSIVTYTGNNTAGATIGHGLNAIPQFIITFNRGGGREHAVWHSGLSSSGTLYLANTYAADTYPNRFDVTGFTSNVFKIGSTTGTVNEVDNYVAYCFAPVAGYSSFGSYTGNGVTDGPFVYLGFRPAFVLVKMSSSTGQWTILDYKREGYNVDNDALFPNLDNTEGSTDLIDILSNGFKVRITDASFNTNGGTYIYAAFAEFPFQYARAR